MQTSATRSLSVKKRSDTCGVASVVVGGAEVEKAHAVNLCQQCYNERVTVRRKSG